MPEGSSQAYEEALLLRMVQDSVIHFLKDNDLNRGQLAALMQVSEGRVSQILSGTPNLTLATLASISNALDARFDVALIDRAKSEVEDEFALDEAEVSLFSGQTTFDEVSAIGSRSGVGERKLPFRIGKRAARTV